LFVLEGRPYRPLSREQIDDVERVFGAAAKPPPRDR